jgi:two-component system copper resistance phosphate regulon response regulator CusR
MVQIFLVEDEDRVAGFVKKALEEEGYGVTVASNGAEAIKQLANKTFDLIILDVMLPHVTGLEVCRQVRQRDKNVPIMMLTALGTIDDKVTGLKAGADDYLVKPFHFKELLARVEALLRRKSADGDKLLTFADIKMDTQSNSVERAGKSIVLTTKEFALMELFIRNSGKVLSRQLIAEKVWGIDFDTGTNVVDVYVNYLRNKVEKGFDQRYIHTVIGRGYILKHQ